MTTPTLAPLATPTALPRVNVIARCAVEGCPGITVQYIDDRSYRKPGWSSIKKDAEYDVCSPAHRTAFTAQWRAHLADEAAKQAACGHDWRQNQTRTSRHCRYCGKAERKAEYGPVVEAAKALGHEAYLDALMGLRRVR